MNNIFKSFNPVFENRVRLAVMSILAVNDRMEFNALKEMLDLTDGNLASHIAMLEKNGYLAVKKRFVGKKPQTSYTATPAGKRAFEQHLAALEKFIKSNLQQ